MTFDDYRYLLKKARDLLRENINPSQVNVCAIAEALVWADGRLGDEVAANDKLDAELAALKEKYRWRVQGKENVPDWECILYITKNKEVRMDVGRGLEDGERWMPLPDLPKEANP